MSQTQIEATALLCRMLESTAKEISGPLLCDPGNQDALAQLRREHLKSGRQRAGHAVPSGKRGAVPTGR